MLQHDGLDLKHGLNVSSDFSPRASGTQAGSSNLSLAYLEVIKAVFSGDLLFLPMCSV